MSVLLKTTLLGLFFGTFGTTMGGIIGTRFKNTSNQVLSFVLSLASGLMTAIVCFDLIPEALEISNMPMVIGGILFGIFVMILCDILVQKKFNWRNSNQQETNHLLKTGIVISIGLALHNFPEGLAIGSGFEVSFQLGLSLAVAILLHDVPEGISMALPMKNGGMKTRKVLCYVILSGVTTGVGAFFGVILGGISPNVIAICLSFAAGAMLYIISGELIPESNQLYQGRINTMGTIVGILLGMLTTLV